MPQPLVSCLMPTQPGREEMAKLAVQDFQAQTWTNKELVIVTKHTDREMASFKHWLNSLCDPTIHFFHHEDPNATLGRLRNMTNDLARGEFCATWDDDDRNPPDRLQRHYDTLQENDADVTYLNQQLHLFPNDQAAFWVDWKNFRSPGYIFYRKTDIRYLVDGPDANLGEDKHFLRAFDAAGKKFAAVISLIPLYVRYYHGNNAWNRKHHWNLATSFSVPSQRVSQQRPQITAMLRALNIRGPLKFFGRANIAKPTIQEIFEYSD